jgi:NADH:quinone reductase (non-electrogenic)
MSFLLKLARKARLFLEWNWAMFFPPDISHVGLRRSQQHEAMRTTSAGVAAAPPEPVQLTPTLS